MKHFEKFANVEHDVGGGYYTVRKYDALATATRVFCVFFALRCSGFAVSRAFSPSARGFSSRPTASLTRARTKR